jgi:hypothetical protein
MLDKMPDILASSDKLNASEATETDISAFAASFLIERGYPVMHTDHYSLQHDILSKTFGQTEDVK